ncbi:MAG: Rid family detoxifying hydrolase, partial [Lentisphaeria bacterium]
MKTITTEKAPAAIGPYSQAKQVGNLIFTSGQIALLPNGDLLQGDVEAQTEQVLHNLAEVLIAGGSSLNNVIKTTVFIKDMNDFAKINAIYAKHFGEHKPARS